MIYLVLLFYFSISIYEVKHLYNNDLKREIPLYIFIMSISVIISSLEALNIEVPDPMIPFSKFLRMFNIF
ncbi:hypothetical protein HAHI6034_02125 [Hathewaya histolytica]|uniref:Uncharacterized protein n=1 Tax=Hathewaya histolytica TaxID=1498 RepID=A0A4U9RKH2_HATHI|nr:hypothetical protein [Hathewaya histolytica]VTQ91103.1 Uncharacterised protein [Hathewaya histolytica]